LANKKLAIVLGIRPDVIRASLILNSIRGHPDVDVTFIWSGQHYSDNLKDIFFRELGVARPEIELGVSGTTDGEISASVIAKLFPVLGELKPHAVIFLGDTNTVMGCIAVVQHNIPLVHIEGCMRAYDWRMPEEKCRTTIDHLSDVIYTYFDEYKAQGVAEGLNPASIVVVQNLIVDVLDRYYFARKAHYDDIATDSFFSFRGLRRGEYYLSTCHRRENVEDPFNLTNVLGLFAASDRTVYFPASYRTQRKLKEFGFEVPANVELVDPIGYDEMLALMVNSRGVLTDSGTVVEETAVLGVPSVQMRRSTERPQVYDCRSSVKFDPGAPEAFPLPDIIAKLESLAGTTWEHGLGDGRASERIVADLLDRLSSDGFRMHLPKRYHVDISRSFRGDGL
jgi:UDP-N-acetylglucosamine 2-epimerase